jgi:hypothetical protein
MSCGPDWAGHSPGELDQATTDALIEGSLFGADIPAGYEDVAHLIAMIRHGLEPEDSLRESRTVTGVVELLNRPHGRVSKGVARGPRRRRKRGLVAVAAVGLLLSAGTAAAATGHLPAALQAAVRDMAARLGIPVPGRPGSTSRPVPGPERFLAPTADRPISACAGLTPSLWRCGETMGPSIVEAARPETTPQSDCAGETPSAYSQRTTTAPRVTVADRTSPNVACTNATSGSGSRGAAHAAGSARATLSASKSVSPASRAFSARGSGSRMRTSGSSPANPQAVGSRGERTGNQPGSGQRGSFGSQVATKTAGDNPSKEHGIQRRTRPAAHQQTQSPSTATKRNAILKPSGTVPVSDRGNTHSADHKPTR